MHQRFLSLVGFSLLTALFIPLISYLSAAGIQANFDQKFLVEAKKENTDIPDTFSINEHCNNPIAIAQTPSLRPLCARLEDFNVLKYWSIVVGAIGFGFIVFVCLSGLLARKSRTLLVLIFGPGLKVSQLTVSFLVLGHGLLLVSSIYYLESYWLNRVHFALIGVAGLSIGVASLSVLVSLFKNFKNAEAFVLGYSLKREEAPKIWDLIDCVAKQAGTESPQNLIVGMSPNFFVTEAKVKALDGIFTGRTLYISVPFCRLLNVSELRAILGHELGHFVGNDTKFSRHFYPIYRGAHESISVLRGFGGGESGIYAIALLPATFMMTLFISIFEQIEAGLGRDREIEADRFAGKICGNDAIAMALVKVHAYANIWPFVEKKMLQSLSEGRQLVNASLFFENIAVNLSPSHISEGLGESHTEHPTDSHPSLNIRLKSLGVNLSQQMIERLSSGISDPSSSYIDNIDEVEQALTDIEHRKISHQYNVAIPQREEIDFNIILIRSMICMGLADGKISGDEIYSIRKIYQTLVKKELSVDDLSREVDLTKAWKEGLLDYLQRANLQLTAEGKHLVIRALLLVAAADGELHSEEEGLVANVAKIFNIDSESFKRIVDETFEKAS